MVRIFQAIIEKFFQIKMLIFIRYLTERGQELISDHGNLSDMQKIIKRAAEVGIDFSENLKKIE